MKTSTNFEQRRDRTFNRNAPAAGAQHPRYKLEQGAFTRSVFAHQTKYFTLQDTKIDIFES